MFFNRKKANKKAELATKIQLLEADIKDELNTLRGLENLLQHDKPAMSLILINSIRLQIKEIEIKIISKREELGHLNELLEIEK